MSTTTIRRSIAIGGVLTDATTATIHVTRDDTGADVVAALTPMTNDLTGVYSHTFVDDDYDLHYSYTCIFTMPSTAVFTVSGTQAGAVSPSAVARSLQSKTAICNLALAKLGFDAVTDIDADTSAAAGQCRLHYVPARDALLRAHAWKFATERRDLIADVATDSGTATAGAATSLTDTGQTWTPDAYIGYYVWITGGTGGGQVRLITDNDATSVTVGTWVTNPDDTSTYEIWLHSPPPPWDYQFVLPTDIIRLIDVSVPETAFSLEDDRLRTDEDAVLIRYIKRVTDEAQFDPLFVQAFVTRLSANICMPLLRDKAWRDRLDAEAGREFVKARNADWQETDRAVATTWNEARQ